MSAFSWSEQILVADRTLLRQAKTLAKNQDKQYKLDHPDESKDATRDDYTKLTLRIKQELQVKRKALKERRERIAIGQT